jgi:ligand-binding sensor domain-containing protein
MNNWVNITGTLPSKYVTSVNFSKNQSGTLYVTMSGYYTGFTSALVFKSTDNGVTWIDISNNLPAIGVNDLITVLSNPGNEELLFIGTDAGVFVSEDEGQSWDLMGSGLPTITIDAIDVSLSDRKIIAGTYGRSMWSYDISAALGVDENSETVEALVYPNPTTGQIQFSQSAKEVRIYTSDGKLVFETENYEAEKILSLDHLLPGFYVVQLDKTSVNLKIE